MTPGPELRDGALLEKHCHVDGKATPAKSGNVFEVIDPGTGRAWAACPDCAAPDVDPAVQSAHAAFRRYAEMVPRKRAQLLLRWHRLIEEASEDLARILVYETGKPLAEARGEIEYALTFSWWFVGEAERIQGSTISSAMPGRRSFTIKQPLGVAAALVPWNFPAVLMLRKACAALAAGCTMVVKPSPETPLSALALAKLATRAGFPPGVLNVVTTSLENTPAVAEALCLHPLVKKVTFTGSSRVGKIIQGLCARNLKRNTLELGGNCPFIVFGDADVEHALAQLVALKWRHAGQACVSANRVYVDSKIHEAFVKRLVGMSSGIRVGHGMSEGVTMGSLTVPQGIDKGEDLAQDAVERGATVAMGTGRRRSTNGAGGGYFMEPTILTGMTDSMRMTNDEIFAPVLGVYSFETEEEVIGRANDTSMGLTSYVFTKDVDRLWRLFEKIEAGMVGLVSLRSLGQTRRRGC